MFPYPRPRQAADRVLGARSLRPHQPICCRSATTPCACAARPPSLAGPRRGKLLIATVQYTLCVGLCITYSVTAGQSLKGVASEECSGVDCQQVGGVT